MNASRAVAICAVIAAGCRGKERPPPAPAAAAPPVRVAADFDTKHHIVAVSPTAKFVVARDGDRLVVWSDAGEQHGGINALLPGDKADYDRVAIDDGGTVIAESGDNTVHVTEIATGRELWRVDDANTVWGDLAFSPPAMKQLTLSLPMQGAVMVVDARTGVEVHPIDPEPLTLPRHVWYADDGTRVAIRCGTDREVPANHSLFVVEAGTGRLLADIPGHDEMVTAMQWLADGRIATLDDHGVRIARDDVVEQTLAISGGPDGTVSAFAVSDDLATVVAAGSALTVWRDGQGIARTPFGHHDDPVLRVDLVGGDRARVIFHDGVVKTYPLPTATPPATQWTVLDARTRARDTAIWRVARGQSVPAGALDGDDPLTAAARAYAAWKQAPGTPFRGPFAMELMARLIRAGFVADADALYAAWLDANDTSTDAHEAADVGHAIVVAHEANDVESPLLRRIHDRFPLDPAITMRYAEAIKEHAPAEARAALRACVAANRHDVVVWAALIWTDKASAAAIRTEAHKTLDPAEAEQLDKLAPPH